MAPLNRIADLAYPGTLLPPLGGLHPETGFLRPLPSRIVAIRPIRLGRGQTPLVHRGGNWLGRRSRPDDQRLQNVFGLDAVVGVGSGQDEAQRHSPVIASQVQGRAGLGAIYWAGAGLFAPFFDGFLEPSRRI